MCRPPTSTVPLVVARAVLLVTLLSAQSVVLAQATSRFPAEAPETNLAPIGPPASTAPPTGSFGAPPYNPPAAPPSTLGQFDPYSRQPGRYGGGVAPSLAPSSSFPGNSGLAPGSTAIGPPIPAPPPPSTTAGGLGPAPQGGSLFSRIFSQPASSPMAGGYGTPAPVANSQVYGPPASGTYDNPNVYGPPVSYGGGAGAPFPSGAYPSSTPSTLFPNGMFGNYGSGGGYPGNYFQSNPVYSAFRLFQGPRFRHGFIGSSDGVNALNENNTDVSAVFAFPNFCYSTQPLLIIPSFSLTLWDGPGFSTGADLPPNAYAAFLDAGWQSDPNQILGTELGVRVGAFSDFNTSNSESLRVLGKGLVHFRLTPTSTLRGGVYYLDRNSIKLVPAIGVLCQPNPYSRYDIFFPQPKISKYLSTIGTYDLWWYLAGDYGGGNWTVTRRSGLEDSVDINELEALIGLEWGTSDKIRVGRRTGFMEIGYVFDRDVEYKRTPADNFSPKDAFMIRAGIGY